ncbi:hypothetical protein LTR95_003682 [Oleoguttula sp. CCFEE 5521]
MFKNIEIIYLSNDDNMSTPTVKQFTGMGLDGTTAGKVTITSRGSKDSGSLAALRARHAASITKTESQDPPLKKRKADDVGNDKSRKSTKTATVESAGGFKLPSSIDQIRKIIPETGLSLSDKSINKQKVDRMKPALPKKLNATRGETHNKRRQSPALTLITEPHTVPVLTSPPSSAVKATAVESPLFCTPPPPNIPPPPSTPPPSRRAQRDYEKKLAELRNAPKMPPRKFSRSSYVEATRRFCDDTDDDEDLLDIKAEDKDGSSITLADSDLDSKHATATQATSDLWSAVTTGIYGILGPKKDSQKATPASGKKPNKASNQDYDHLLPAPVSQGPAMQALLSQATQQTQQRTAQQTTAKLQQTVKGLLSNLTHISQVPAIIAAQQQVFDHQLAAQQQVFDHQYRDMQSSNTELTRRLVEVERDNSRFKNGTFPNTLFENRVAAVEKEQVDVKKEFDDQCHRFVGSTNVRFMERDVKVAKLETELDRVINEMEELKRVKKED